MTRQPDASGSAGLGEATALPDAHCTATRHGTATAYRDGCRCDSARAVMARTERIRVKRRYLTRGPLLTSARGTHRRLQALQANGWPRRELAARLGYTSGCLPELTHDVIHIDTAARVRALYDDLADVPGPSSSSRIRARAKGWLPPIWWDDDSLDNVDYKDMDDEFCKDANQADVDEVAVDRYLAGDDTISLQRDEKRAAFGRLIAAGYAPNAAGKRLGINGQYAARYAREAGIGVGAGRDDAPMTYDPQAVA